MHNRTKIKIFRIACWFTYPLALISIYPLIFFKKKKSNLIFFFDRYSIGGAQRVHLDILESVKDTYKEVYFTRKSVDTSFKELFKTTPNSKIADIHFWCDNLLIRLFTVHFYAFYINRHKKLHVFSSNSTFFYDLLPFLRRDIIATELLHNFTFGKNGMEFFGLANYTHLTHRIVIDTFTLQNIQNQYKQYLVPDEYKNRLVLWNPGVDVPFLFKKVYDLPLNILYAGRGGTQKRIHLLNAIAEHCIKASWPVQFYFAGPMENELTEFVKQNAVLQDKITTKGEMNKLYEKMHVLLMTSAYEGFPMLIKEGMAWGCIPVVTALEGNRMHLRSYENALLIEAVEDEAEVVKQGISRIQELLADTSLLKRISASAYQYSSANFNKNKFIETSRAFLLTP
jgi:glycosyltransferase involved in cell wall biosynthesis